MFDLLAASGPFNNSEKLMLYTPFIGSWDVEVTWYRQDGTQRTGKGEWHFNWILGGRGVQDVLFACDVPSHQFGTTLRCYDAHMDAWHVSWMHPAGGEFVNLVGYKVGDRIVHEGVGTDTRRRERWSFTEITPTSFVWLGEASFDDGATWFLEQEMRATRRGTATDSGDKFMSKGFTAKSTIQIDAPATRVWQALVDPALIRQYLFDTEVTTDWKVGSPITYKGVWEGKPYEDKGTILQIEPETLLITTYWSAFSGLPDVPESYQTVRYELSPDGTTRTVLTVTQDNITSEEDVPRFEQNWNMTLEAIKKVVEDN
ncbi:MAG TPA: SRPBCC family protein [Anaerolineales bacterium]|nr:SRPBCC family protein [Anaerolineales bacterium]